MTLCPDRGVAEAHFVSRKFGNTSSLNKAPRLFQLAGYLYAKMNGLDAAEEDFANDGPPQFPFYSAADTAGLGEVAQLGEPTRRVARARPQPVAPPLYRKKSMDQKQIRFHQCYFNPISCFRK